MTWTRRAKCKDCKYLKEHSHHYRRTFFTCDRMESPHYGERRTLKDFVCDFWKYIYE
jgi:hypothetical protein